MFGSRASGGGGSSGAFSFPEFGQPATATPAVVGSGGGGGAQNPGASAAAAAAAAASTGGGASATPAFSGAFGGGGSSTTTSVRMHAGPFGSTMFGTGGSAAAPTPPSPFQTFNSEPVVVERCEHCDAPLELSTSRLQLMVVDEDGAPDDGQVWLFCEWPCLAAFAEEQQ